MSTPRILLCGDVLGNLDKLFKRVSSVNKSSGPFDCLFCVGQFFPDSLEFLEAFLGFVGRQCSIPLPTYFTGDYGVGSEKVLSAASMDPVNKGFKMEGLEICRNLYWLRGGGKFIIHGLSVAYLSGRSLSGSRQFGKYTQDDIDTLRAISDDAGLVDLFLTNEWPSNVANTSGKSDMPSEVTTLSGCNEIVSEIVAEIKPRYHIAGTKNVFYAREPYVNAGAVHVTRFLGLASVGNNSKQKFIHAISPTPASLMSAAEVCKKPPNTTSSPYAAAVAENQNQHLLKRSGVGESFPESQYWRYDVSDKRQRKAGRLGRNVCFKFVMSGDCENGGSCDFSHDSGAREQYNRGVCFEFITRGRCERGSACRFKHAHSDAHDSSSHTPVSEISKNNRSKECWFCLCGKNVESHLIVTIGDTLYCTLAKGPLTKDHILVIPIEHLPNSISLPQDFDTELLRFQNSIELFFNSQDMQVVFFEWACRSGSHANIQAVPFEMSKASVVKDVFYLAAERLGFKFRTFYGKGSGGDRRKLLRTQLNEKQSFFYAELPDSTVLFHSVNEDDKFPPQFGRQVMAGFLNKPGGADWRNCVGAKDDEMNASDDFKARFEKFDPARL